MNISAQAPGSHHQLVDHTDPRLHKICDADDTFSTHRTVPFVAKAVGHPIAKYASLLMAGKTLKEIGFTEEPIPTKHVAVKEVVLPFNKFPGAQQLLFT